MKYSEYDGYLKCSERSRDDHEQGYRNEIINIYAYYTEIRAKRRANCVQAFAFINFSILGEGRDTLGWFPGSFTPYLRLK